MSIKYRKAIPSPPKWFWLDRDNCWACKRNTCGKCKALKEVVYNDQPRKKKWNEVK